jgi:hypothetical protein
VRLGDPRCHGENESPVRLDLVGRGLLLDKADGFTYACEAVLLLLFG